MLNKFVKLGATALLTAGLVACSSSSNSSSSTAQTLTGSAEGRNGTVTVEVDYDNGTIKSVTVTEQQETEGVADGALEEVPAAIVEANSTDVDGVSGATLTSNAIKEAVDNALATAE